MLLSLSKNFLFVHNSKTGGGSVKLILRPHAIRPEKTQYRRLLSHIPIGENPWKATLRPHATANWARIKLGDKLFSRLYKFAFVRNPFDSMVSRYEYIRQTAKHHRYRTVSDLSFSKFVDWQCNGILKRKMDQCRFVLSFSGELLVDDIYKFESIDDEVPRLCKKLGLEPPEILPHHHRTERRPFQDYYTRQDREAVARAFARDLEYFKYSFDDSFDNHK